MAAASRSSRQFSAALGAIALLLGGMWVAVNNGPMPESAEASERFLAVIFQCIRAIPKLAPLWLAVLGLGLPIRKWLAPHARQPIAVQMAAGLGVMLLLDWLLALAGWLNPWTAWAVLGLGTAVITYHFADAKTREAWHPDHWPSPPWTVLLALPVLGMTIVACCCPPGTLWSTEAFGYDVMSYHLQIPVEWMQAGGMKPLEHNVYSFLPSLVEAGYYKLAILHGSVYDAIYTIQLFHASVAVLAAAALGKFAARFTSPAPAALAGVALLAMPWVVITASLAYDEMFVLAFAAAALMLAFDPAGSTVRGAIFIGLLLGLATMAKLTAAGLVVLPIVAVLMMRWLKPRPEGRGPTTERRDAAMDDARDAGGAEARTLPGGASVPRMFSALFLGLLLAVAPYLIRNALWTGNPVFPFATGLFGKAHWNDALVKRWSDAHHSKGLGEGVSQIVPRWLLNPGYGTLGPPAEEPDAAEKQDVTRFSQAGVLPSLWILAAIGAVLCWKENKHRDVVIALLIMLGVQLLFWLLATHHQSRFLLPTLLPGCALAAMGIGRIGELTRQTRPHVLPTLAIAWTAMLTILVMIVLFTQTIRVRDESTGRIVSVPVWPLIDSLIERADVTTNQPGRFAGLHPVNYLPPGSRVLFVGDVGGLMYVATPFIYSTAFDRSLLAELIELHKGNPQAVTAALAQRRITHVWIDVGEIARLQKSYGVDDAIKVDNLEAFVQAAVQRGLWQRMPESRGLPVQHPKYLFRVAPLVRMQFTRPGEDKEKGGTP